MDETNQIKLPEIADHAVGVRLVLIYKATKAALMLLSAVVLGVALLFGFAHYLQGVAQEMRLQVTHAWSQHLAEFLLASSTNKRLAIAVAAMAIDGCFTGVEAWALKQGHWWGPWLVVVATSTLIPWEVYEVIEYVRWGRVLLLVVNVTIVVYLTLHALRLRRMRRGLAVHRVGVA